MDNDYNRIEPWLKAKLAARRMTTHRFASKMGVTSATIYRWYSDRFRPTPETMKRVCEALSIIPVRPVDSEPYLNEIPWEEGMAQYTLRPEDVKEKKPQKGRRINVKRKQP